MAAAHRAVHCGPANRGRYSAHMPEGHTIHALAERLNRAFAGHAIHASSPQGRFAGGAGELDGTEFLAAQAWGKHLLVEFAAERWLHVHLGLIGNFAVVPLPAQERGESPEQIPVTGTVRLRLVGPEHVADLRGPMTCALHTPEEIAAVVGKLGPDPLRSPALLPGTQEARAQEGRAQVPGGLEAQEHVPGTQVPDDEFVSRQQLATHLPAAQAGAPPAEAAWARIRRSGKPIAELLLDQHVVAGVGNVYRCEVLFRHRVDPRRPGRQLRERTWNALWEDLVELMPLGVAFGQILTMDDQVARAQQLLGSDELRAHTEALTGERLGEWFERRFFVYGREGEPCRVCGARIRAAAVGGRRLFWCGRCQRRR